MTTAIPQAILESLTNVAMPHHLAEAQPQQTLTLGEYRIPVYDSEALVVGSRILVLSPHPGRVRAELNCHQFTLNDFGSEAFQHAASHIHDLLFPANGNITSHSTGKEPAYVAATVHPS